MGTAYDLRASKKISKIYCTQNFYRHKLYAARTFCATRLDEVVTAIRKHP